MPIPRLDARGTALLVIDLQERLLPTIVDRHRVAKNAALLLQMSEVLRMPFLVTEQYPHGLGRTVDVVADAMPDRSRRVEKTRFSAVVDVVDDQLRGWGTQTIIICGVEAHVCVLQTVLDLQAGGRQCFVVTDAVSASQRDQIPFAIDRMQRAGAVMTGVLSLMYELLGDARHPGFRACLELAKQVEQ